MTYLRRNWAFVLFAAILFIINGFLLNDVASIWSGAETSVVTRAQAGVQAQLPVDVARLTGAANSLSGLVLRLPGLVLCVLALTVFFFLGRRVFGVHITLHALLVLLAGFWVVTLAKLGSGDVWLLAFQMTGMLGVILFLKRPIATYRLLTYVMILLSIWVDAFSSSLLFVFFPLILVFLHPQGKRLVALHTWFFAAASVGLLYVAGVLEWMPDIQYTGWGRMSWGRFSIFLLLSILPFLGFFFAGLWDSVQKARKGEELALILLIWIVLGVALQSPAVIGGVALLTGKHLHDYFLKNYPHDNIVKVTMLLHLIGFFFVAMILMLGGFFQYRGVGFRSGMAFSAVYWMMSFVGVIGLYGHNQRFVLGGSTLAGLLAVALFWLQVFPLWEQQRPARTVVEVVEDIGTDTRNVLLLGPLTGAEALPLYLAKAGKIVKTEKAAGEAFELMIAPVDSSISYANQDTVQMLNDHLELSRYVIGH